MMALGLWLGLRSGVARVSDAAAAGNTVGRSRQIALNGSDDAGPFRTKASSRPVGEAQPTHGPQRLREFMLPALKIEGLTLEDALQKLMDTYEMACAKSGETPLPLTFSIDPQARPRKLTFHFPTGDFNSSVRLLATLAGMKVSRDGREFRFEPMPKDDTAVSREMRVPPDFNSMLNQMAGVMPPPDFDPFAEQPTVSHKTVSESLQALGIELDPTTLLKLDFAGVLKLETRSAADAAVIAEITKLLSASTPKQLKFDPMVLELAAGSDWSPPDISQMTEPEVQKVMRDLAQRAGTDLQSLPSVTAKMGQGTAIEIINEVNYPTDDSGETLATRDVGKVMKVKGGMLGFGQEVSLNYTDTTVDSSTGKPVFDVRTDMSDEGFSSDGGSRFVVQTRPDGSKTVVLLKSTVIDATGRPLR